MVDVDDRGLDLDALVAEELELHHGHRPGGVLRQRLVDRDRNLGARNELAPDEVLFENRACERGHRPQYLKSAATPSAGPRSSCAVTAQTVPPWATVWCTVRSSPSSRRSVSVPIERALPARGGEPSARGALPGLVVCAVLVEQSLDACVRGGLERLGPAGCGAATTTGPLAPALEQRGLVACARCRRGSGSSVRAGPAGEACASALVQPTTALFVSLRETAPRTRRASPPTRRRSPSARASCARGGRAPRPPLSGAPRRASRCAAGIGTATSRPGRGGRERRRYGRRSRPAVPARSRNRSPRSRPTKATIAPSPRPTSGTSGARWNSRPTRTRSGTDSIRARGRQTLSIPAEKTATPCAPSRSNSLAK